MDGAPTRRQRARGRVEHLQLPCLHRLRPGVPDTRCYLFRHRLAHSEHLDDITTFHSQQTPKGPEHMPLGPTLTAVHRAVQLYIVQSDSSHLPQATSGDSPHTACLLKNLSRATRHTATPHRAARRRGGGNACHRRCARARSRGQPMRKESEVDRASAPSPPHHTRVDRK